VHANLVNLHPKTEYHYRLVATSGTSTHYGSDQTFTTDPPLSIFWIHHSDTHSSLDTARMVFGNHVYATYDVDSALYEYRSPPSGPWYEALWKSIPGRINTWGNYGLLAKDLREVVPMKKDTFSLEITSPDASDTDNATLTWPDSSYIATRTDSMTLVILSCGNGECGIPGGQINMMKQDSVTIISPYRLLDDGGWNAVAPHLKLYIFKYGTKLPLVDAVKRGKDQTPREFRLEQNYPNPFNPETRFEFSVSRFANVSLKVYDVLGREVATIVNEELLPGEYTRTWDATSIPSGIYFYRMTAGRFAETRKLVILR